MSTHFTAVNVHPQRLKRFTCDRVTHMARNIRKRIYVNVANVLGHQNYLVVY